MHPHYERLLTVYVGSRQPAALRTMPSTHLVVAELLVEVVVLLQQGVELDNIGVLLGKYVRQCTG